MATYDLTQGIPTSLKKNDILNCPYSGRVIEIELPKGTYDLSLFGGQGGTSSSRIGGYGGTATGRLTLKDKTKLFLYTGGQGSSSNTTGGFNGGGTGVSNGRGGGGASDIRLRTDSLYSRVIVASGGGGAGVTTASANPAGCGGGEYGGDGYYNNFDGSYITGQNRSGGGASYNQGGISWNSIESTRGQFGIGGNAYRYSCGGGGSGWYGGGGAYDSDSDSDGRWGGGGSGYIYTEQLKSRYPSGCTLTNNDLLTNATYSNSSHTGDGYITITIIDIKNCPVRYKQSNTWKETSALYIKQNDNWTLVENNYQDYIKQVEKYHIII